MRKFFAWCTERGVVEDNPCVNIRAPAAQRSRDLTDAELTRVWRACDEVGYPYGDIVRPLILTAQRRGEVTAMAWGELDLQAATWSIPAKRTKSTAHRWFHSSSRRWTS
jgi:integrase